MIPNFIVALIASNQLMIQAVSRGVESIQLMIQAGFMELTQINSRLKRILQALIQINRDSNGFPRK